MILAVDIGNTNIVAGLFRDGRLRQTLRFDTRRIKNPEDLKRVFSGYPGDTVSGAIFSSVVPRLDTTTRAVIRSRFAVAPLRVTHRIRTGIRIGIDNPRELGADRLVNASSGYRKYGGPLLIVDFGTATTVCAITGAGSYLGGAILPGLGLSVDALSTKTAKLPRIGFGGPVGKTGRSTREAMRIGIVEGHAGAVERVIRRMSGAFRKNPKVIATGGLATFMSHRIGAIQAIEPYLTLEGLYAIYHLNR